jgi:hypothetical protein
MNLTVNELLIILPLLVPLLALFSRIAIGE